jgi:hypothetical protein
MPTDRILPRQRFEELLAVCLDYRHALEELRRLIGSLSELDPNSAALHSISSLTEKELLADPIKAAVVLAREETRIRLTRSETHRRWEKKQRPPSLIPAVLTPEQERIREEWRRERHHSSLQDRLLLDIPSVDDPIE